MREGWEIKKIEEITSKLGDGLHGTPKYCDNGEYYFINGNNLNNGQIIFKEKTKRVSLVEYEKYKKKLTDRTVFVSINGTLGNVAFYNDEKIILGKSACYFNLLDGIDKKFIKYVIQSPNFIKYMFAQATGATIKNVSLKSMKNYEIALPPVQEQKKIVALLDKAFTAIDQAKANIEKNIVNAKELFQSKLNAIFSQKGEGWEDKTLGELGTLTSSKRIYKKEYVAEGIPFYRSKEIKELAHKKDITLELFITKERYKEIKTRFGIPQEGDILLTAVGTIGEMYVVKNNEPDFYFKDGNIMWLKNFTTLNAYYLKYALLCFVEQLKAMSQGSAYSALTIEKLKKYSISVPSVSEQKEIVKNLDELLNYQRRIDRKYKQKLIELEELKNSILQKAFSGELTQKEVEV
jgi:type I restriction enzyme S subunit